MVTAEIIKKETEAIVDQLKSISEQTLPEVWESLRRTHIPFIPILLRGNPGMAHSLCGNVLRSFGKYNMGFAYALENHLYVLGGLEMYQAMSPNDTLLKRMNSILAERSFVANTHAYVHSNVSFCEGMTAKQGGDSIEINGSAHFISLARTADQVLLTLDGRDPVAILFPFRGDKSIVLGDYSFPSFLIESDTRSATCHNTIISNAFKLDIPRDDLLLGGKLAVALLGWHLTLLASAFLGGASHILDATVQFVHSFKSYDNRLLCRLDGIIAEMGQIRAQYGAAESLLNDYTSIMRTFGCREGDPADHLRQSLSKAQIANNLTMELIEDISSRCRRILGTRVFTPQYETTRKIMIEMLVGQLVPRNSAILRRDIGHSLLLGKNFGGVSWD